MDPTKSAEVKTSDADPPSKQIRKRKYPPVRLMTPAEKEKHINELKEHLNNEKDRKKRDDIYKRLNYLKDNEQRKINRQLKYNQNDKEALRKTYEEKLRLLSK